MKLRKTKWPGNISITEDTTQKFNQKSPFTRPRCRWEDNIATDLINALPGSSSVNTIHYATIDCSLWGPRRCYITRFPRLTRVETGSNTSTVTLRVVGGDEKGNLKSEAVKYGRKSQGTRTRERLRWQGPTAHTKDRPVLSSERTPHGIKNITVRHIPYSVRI
jgi:hypothetical protein